MRAKDDHRRLGMIVAIATGVALMVMLVGFAILGITPNDILKRSTATTDRDQLPEASATPVSSEDLPQESPTIAAPTSLLTLIQFPHNQITYPADWPLAYRLPETLILVDAQLGTLGEGHAFSAKLRSPHTPRDIVHIVEAFVEELGWQVVEIVEVDDNHFLITAKEPDGFDNGFFVIDADTEAGSRIMVVLAL